MKPKLDKNNANKGTERGKQALQTSLKKLGAGRSVLLDKNGVAIAGNKTLEQAQSLGLPVEFIETDGTKLIAVVRKDLDLEKDAKARELAFADNRVSELDLEWDLEVIQQATTDDIDLTWLWTEDELQDLLTQHGFGCEPGEDDEDAVADEMESADGGGIESRVSLGEIWALGRHRIACGDSTDEGNIERIFFEKQFNMLLTDPPYGVSRVSGTKDPRDKNHKSGKKIENDDLVDDELRSFLLKAFKAADSRMKCGAVYYVFYPDIFAYEFIGAIRDAGWKQARPSVVLWIKDHFVFGQGDYHSRSEPILYGWKPGDAHKPVADRTQDNVWEFDRPTNEKAVHPSVKPTELLKRCINNSTNLDDLIFDPFLGSGTSIIAAQQMPGNRTVYGFELSPEYCEVICRRYERLTGQNAVLSGHL